MKSCVVDTNVLHHANRFGTKNEVAAQRRRLALLKDIVDRKWRLLLSVDLMKEYDDHLRGPYNDYLQAFLTYAADPASLRLLNWTKLSGSQRDRALKTCRFPKEDLMLLQTAFGVKKSNIFSEEDRVVRTGKCIHLHFSVSVSDPTT